MRKDPEPPPFWPSNLPFSSNLGGEDWHLLWLTLGQCGLLLWDILGSRWFLHTITIKGNAAFLDAALPLAVVVSILILSTH